MIRVWSKQSLAVQQCQAVTTYIRSALVLDGDGAADLNSPQ